MSDLHDLEKLKRKIRVGTLLTIGVFAGMFYLVWTILHRLQLGDISVHVFLLLLLLMLTRPRVQPVVMMPPNLFGKENYEGMEVE